MKYTVTINQAAAAALGDLDLDDCAIIEWLSVICNTKNEAIAKERIGKKTWIKYGHLIHDMPLIKPKTKEALRKRLVHLRDRGYIAMETVKQRVYVELLSKCEKLYVDNFEGYAFRSIKPSTQVDSYYIKSISKKRKGSTEKTKRQEGISGYQKFQQKKAELRGKQAK